jgi:hypothetical protein
MRYCKLANGCSTVDRRSRIASGLAPDVAIPGGNAILPPARDPVVQSALDWLCGAPGSDNREPR